MVDRKSDTEFSMSQVILDIKLDPEGENCKVLGQY